MSSADSDAQASREEPSPAGPAPADGWYVACESSRLGRAPFAISLRGSPLVLFRGTSGQAGAFPDRCPHRNVPLSMGRVRGDELECCYHGWRFDARGECRFVPGMPDQRLSAARRVPTHSVRESDGFVWVWGRADSEPAVDPFRFPLLDRKGYTTFRRQVDVRAAMCDAAENALDVPHTAFLHGGLFRSSARPPQEIEVRMRRWPDRVEAEYVGEPRPPGAAARILAPRGGTVEHVDRFFLPSIVQVEYRLGEATHFCVSAALTPLGPRTTRLFAVVSFRLPIPGWLVAPFLEPVAMRIFRQDAEILSAQSENVERFGGEDYRSTAADLLGPQVQRLLRRASSGSLPADEEPVERSVRLLI